MNRNRLTPIRVAARLALSALALCTSALAFAANEDGLEIAKKNACIACHGVEKKIVGPSFQAIAQKYKRDKDAIAKIEHSIRTGSQGKWGAIAMPPNAAPKDVDLHLLSAWILSR